MLQRPWRGRPLVYFDSAATALKPTAVLDAVLRFFREQTANVHRAAHGLGEAATQEFERARAVIAAFIGASPDEIAFTRSATESINLVAASFAGLGARVASPAGEHHSNLLPWRRGPHVSLPMMEDGSLDLAGAQSLFRRQPPKLIACSTISNVTGARTPVEGLMEAARNVGALVLLDLCQGIGHEPVHVKALGCDFAVFSGHKLLGPSGVGVLYAARTVQHLLQPLLLGGSMVRAVGLADHQALPFPHGLEAGTPNIEGVIGLAAACEYLASVGLTAIAHHTRALLGRMRAGLAELPGVRMLGPSPEATTQTSIISFTADSVPSHALARVLCDEFSIMVRSGYHCAEPLHRACGWPESVRASLHLYNTHDEVRTVLDALRAVL